MRVVVVGAGIGGLASALALRRAGCGVRVVEQAPLLREAGAGIQISPNGSKVLRALGLLPAVEAIAFAPERIEMRLGKSGALVFSIPLREAAIARWGAPYLHIHRADLLEVLSNALGAETVSLGRKVLDYAQDADKVVVRLDNDETLEADAVIGADGVRSAIREQMLGPEAPRFTGCVAWRAVVPTSLLRSGPFGMAEAPPTACVWVGDGKHAVTYRLRRGELTNFVGVVEHSQWRGESWTERGSRDEAMADFEGWAPPIRAAIANADQHYRWALFDRDPLERWTDGRVALLGDACHPMLPFMAQGAVMAMEDAWVLAACLQDANDVPAALRAYESRRKSRTAKVQLAACANAGIFHRRGVLSKLATYGPMWLGARLAPAAVHARQDWIYGEDVTVASYTNGRGS